MAELTGKDKQERLPRGSAFTVWSPESFSPVSQRCLQIKKHTLFRSTTHAGSVKTHKHGIQLVPSQADIVIVLYK